MTYFLDSNICVNCLRDSSSRSSTTLVSHLPSEIQIPAIVAAELLFGARKSNRSEENLVSTRTFLRHFTITPFDSSAAETYSQLRLDLEQRGQVIGPHDLLIAAIVHSRTGVLVTHNISEFSRIGPLRIEDWQ